MKGLMAKIKALQYKQLLIAHGEKFVLGAVGLTVAFALYSTTWKGYENRPDDLLSKATAAGAKLNTGELPKEKLDQFTPSTYQSTAISMFVPLNNPEAPNPYDFVEPMSFPLYARQEPRGEAVFPPVQHLLADADVMVLGITPSIENGSAEEAEGEQQNDPLKPKVPTKGGLGAPPVGGPGADLDKMKEMMMAGGAGGAGGSTGMQPRGQRYVAVRGVVNLFDTAVAIQRALHLEKLSDAMEVIQVLDFKIQRQKAVPGDNPWPDNTWQDVALERADEVLEESGQMADLVNAGVTDPVFTMPLPTRLDGDYSEKVVSHPMLKDFQLTPEQRAIEQKLNAAFMEEAETLGVEEAATKRRGFLKNQVDIKEVRKNVIGGGGKMEDIMKKAAGSGGNSAAMMQMMKSMQGGPAGGGAIRPPAPNAAGGGASAQMMQMMMMQGQKGGRIGGGIGGGQVGNQQQVGGSAVGYLMLFRFLDFDVNPGDAYRYRVQLEFANPNEGLSLDKVKEAAVAEGESRMTGWSEPTAPVVIKPDTNFFLAKVDKRSRTRGEAELEIFQWDPALGTYINSKKLVAKSGQFIGGLETSDRLDLGVPTLEEKTVLFATKDFLLDTALPPTLVPTENPDLNLPASGRQARELDLPAEAAVLDEYGQLRTLDSFTAKTAAAEEEAKVKKEREPFESLRDKGDTESKGGLNALDGEAGGGDQMKKMMEMMQQGVGSSLKRGGKTSKTATKSKSANPYADPTGATKKKAGR